MIKLFDLLQRCYRVDGALLLKWAQTIDRCGDRVSAARLLQEGNMKSNGALMKSNGTLAIVQSIYDYVHLALWATLAALVVLFLAFTAPRLPEAAARAEALRIQEIAQENEGYCAKWQMGLGTKMHDQCISDLQELRWKIQDRFADRLDF